MFKKRSFVVKGYEPKALTTSLCAMARAASAPPEGSSAVAAAVGNPFYSERTQGEIQLEASRPEGLPSNGASPLPVMHGVPGLTIGKGRGSTGAAMGRRGGAAGVGAFETPPSRMDRQWEVDPGSSQVETGMDGQPVGQRVQQSEGMMPTEHGLQTMGRVPSAVEPSSQDPSELQRALEIELVDTLRRQNAQLLAELDALRQGQQQASTATSGEPSFASWSEVATGPESGQPPNVPMNVQEGHVKRGLCTPRGERNSVQSVSGDVRFTPNGTRVPPGPPPTDSPPVSQTAVAPPPAPVVPPFPLRAVEAEGSNLQQFLDRYESQEVTKKMKRQDLNWSPKELSPRSARTFWLERENESLKKSLEKMCDGNPLQNCEYFSNRFQPPDLSVSCGRAAVPPNVSACAGFPDECQRGRASRAAELGEHALHSRAGGTAELGEHALHSRAGGTAELGEHALHARACGNAELGEHALRGRACGAAELGEHALHGRAGSRADLGDHALQARAGDAAGVALNGADASWGYVNPGDLSADPQARYGRALRHGVGGGFREEEKTYGPIPGSWTETGGDVPRNFKVELPELAADASPLQFGDWIHLCQPTMHDVSAVAGRWWFLTLREAKIYYETWKTASPLERVQMTARLPDELADGSYSRTEQRGVSMLLRAISPDLQQMLVTDRQLTSTAILFRLHVRYQPGGPGEKSIILQQLIALPKCANMHELTCALRSWRRHYGRAREVQASLPDPILLLKALESAVLLISKEDAQASFRLAQSRVQLDVDARPSEASIWSFSQCLLAEAETLVLMASSSTSSTPIKLKQMDGQDKPGNASTGEASASNGKGKGGSTADTPCKWFRTDGGCRAGRNCKWSHSWDGITDKSSRCWICGSKEHRKNDCKVKGGNGRSTKDETKVSGGGAAGGSHVSSSNGGGNGSAGNKRPGTSSTTTSTPSKPILNEMSSTTPSTASTKEVDPGVGGGKDGGTGAATGGKEEAKVAGSELLQEATQLLRALRGPGSLPKINVVQLSSLEHSDQHRDWILLDSGATHALRPAHDLQEWRDGQGTKVMLAQGSTDRFRLKVGTQVLLQEPGTAEPPAWIIPMGGLADIGCSVEWKGSQCKLQDPKGRALTVEVRHGCPMIPQQDGLELLRLMEEHQLRMLKRMLMVKALMADPSALSERMDVELALTLKLQQLFPALPLEVSGRVIPDADTLTAEDIGSRVPWNRSKRRRLAKADKIVVHVFAGDDHKFWEKRLSSHDTEVLCVDLLGSTKANLLDNGVFSFLLRIAASGRMKALLGGPPCRTVSALRYQQDDGPGVVRSNNFPYGLPDISQADRELVISDSVLFFRFLTMFVVAEEVRKPSEPMTAFVCEQPQDPATYRSAEDVEQHQYYAMWRTEEWKAFAELYGMLAVNFDQGVMGHTVRKPTTLGTNLESLMQLDELRGGPAQVSGQPVQDRQQMTVQERCRQSRTWSAWAPGLKEALVLGLQHHLQQCDGESSGEPSLQQAARTGGRQPRMQPLGPVALEQWRQHFQNDHYPARRDCAQCLRAQGRGRPHKRIRHADAFTLAVDLSGRLQPGRDQGNKRAKYFLIGAYTFPVTGDGQPLVQPPGSSEEEDHPLPLPGDGVDESEAEPAPVPHPEAGGVDDNIHLDDDAALLAEGLAASGDGGPPLDADVDDGGQQPAPDPEENRAEAAAKSAFDTWHKLVEQASDVSCKTLTFVEVLESRHTKHVLPALARIHCRLRSLGLPVLRLHSDRARELIAAPIRRWTLDRGIIATMTSGDSFKSNGRAENEVNVTKKAIRAVLEPGEFSLEDWPLIARHIGERRLRHQLNQLGWPTGPLLRFGTKAFAVRKSWKNRYEDWRQVRESIVVLGPDPHSSLSSPSYYVKSLEDGKFFYTDDVVIPEKDLPAANPAEPPLYLLERGHEPRPAIWDNVPTRRLRGKQPGPVVSMLHIEGEARLMKCFPMAFEPRADIPAAVPQGGKRPPLLQLVDATDCFDGPGSDSSDSWTLGTPSSEANLEEESSGGGDVEGVPNSWCGGSSPATPLIFVPGPAKNVTWADVESERQRALRTLHYNLGILAVTSSRRWAMSMALLKIKFIGSQPSMLRLNNELNWKRNFI